MQPLTDDEAALLYHVQRFGVTVQFEALWDALVQYIQNTEDVEEDLDEREHAKLGAARAMLEKMDAAVIATAA